MYIVTQAVWLQATDHHFLTHISVMIFYILYSNLVLGICESSWFISEDFWVYDGKDEDIFEMATSYLGLEFMCNFMHF